MAICDNSPRRATRSPKQCSELERGSSPVSLAPPGFLLTSTSLALPFHACARGLAPSGGEGAHQFSESWVPLRASVSPPPASETPPQAGAAESRQDKGPFRSRVRFADHSEDKRGSFPGHADSCGKAILPPVLKHLRKEFPRHPHMISISASHLDGFLFAANVSCRGWGLSVGPPAWGPGSDRNISDIFQGRTDPVCWFGLPMGEAAGNQCLLKDSQRHE